MNTLPIGPILYDAKHKLTENPNSSEASNSTALFRAAFGDKNSLIFGIGFKYSLIVQWVITLSCLCLLSLVCCTLEPGVSKRARRAILRLRLLQMPAFHTVASVSLLVGILGLLRAFGQAPVFALAMYQEMIDAGYKVVTMGIIARCVDQRLGSHFFDDQVERVNNCLAWGWFYITWFVLCPPSFWVRSVLPTTRHTKPSFSKLQTILQIVPHPPLIGLLYIWGTRRCSLLSLNLCSISALS